MSVKNTSHQEWRFPLRIFLRKGLHASMLRSTAAARAINMAASSTHLMCRIANCTRGLLHFPSPCTLQVMTKPPSTGVSAAKSPLLCGLGTGVAAARTCLSMSMKNSPPFSELINISDIRISPPSCPSAKRWKRQQMESLRPRSRHASSFPQGCQHSGLQGSGRTISQAPGLDFATQSQPVDGTNGVVMNAAATAEPERSCIFTFHPFLSLLSISWSELSTECDQILLLNGSNWFTL